MKVENYKIVEDDYGYKKIEFSGYECSFVVEMYKVDNGRHITIKHFYHNGWSFYTSIQDFKEMCDNYEDDSDYCMDEVLAQVVKDYCEFIELRLYPNTITGKISLDQIPEELHCMFSSLINKEEV